MSIDRSLNLLFGVLLRMVVMAITVSVLCGFSPRAQAQNECPPKTPEIFYLNGVATDIADATDDILRLEVLFPNRKITHAPVNTEGMLRDLVEAYDLKIGETPIDRSRAWINLWRFLLGLAPDNSLLGLLRQSFIESQENNIQKILSTAPDLPDHTSKYASALNRDIPIILLGYSEGSLYTVLGYEWLRQRYPDQLSSVGVVQVASIANSIPGATQGSGKYTTLPNDEVVNLVRRRFPNTLPPNYPDYRSLDDRKNHSFNTYFSENRYLVNRISNGLISVEASLDQPCQKTPPIACGQPVSQTGGPGTFQYRLNLGNQPGIVEWEFEAYRIPDSLRIASSNEHTLATTDRLVSGFHSGSFYFPGVEQGTEVLSIGVNAPDPDTKWQTVVGCPGQDLDNSDRINDRRTVFFHFGNSFSQFMCSLDVLVDGRVEYSTIGKGNFHEFTIQLSQGEHQYSYRNVSCLETSCSICTFWDAYVEFGSSRIPLNSPLSPGSRSGTLIVP